MLEAVFYCAGTGGQVELYARNAANDEGILAFYAFGANFSLATISGGTPTTKVSVATGLSSPPLGACWFYFGVEYNHTTDGVKLRIIEIGATGATQEDTGWVDVGTITPTYDNTEWINFYGLSKSNTAAYQGYAQLRVANSDNDGYGLGEFEQHNYVVP